jgi:arsenite methyltransferase
MSAITFKKPNSDADAVREEVRRHYAAAAEGAGCCDTGGCGDRSCATEASELGYTAEDIANLPAGADLGLGCGNPQAIAALKAGETALDLGSGAGFDCFLAAKAVGSTGRAIGVDMTPEMLAKARANAQRAGLTNVEFRLGEIEALPVGDNSVDVILSNCVINLSPDKPRVFAEAFRVLKPGGRLAIADIVRTAELPPEIQADLGALCGCVSGAASIEELETMLKAVGFEAIRIQPKDASREFVRRWVPGKDASEFVVSSTIEARKPGGACCDTTCCTTE